jgi:hypothetical protein
MAVYMFIHPETSPPTKIQHEDRKSGTVRCSTVCLYFVGSLSARKLRPLYDSVSRLPEKFLVRFACACTSNFLFDDLARLNVVKGESAGHVLNRAKEL